MRIGIAPQAAACHECWIHSEQLKHGASVAKLGFHSKHRAASNAIAWSPKARGTSGPPVHSRIRHGQPGQFRQGLRVHVSDTHHAHKQPRRCLTRA